MTATALLLIGCTSDTADNTPEAPDDAVDTEAPVTISISDLPTTENQESRDAMLARIDAFEEQHPNITVEATEAVWTADTFQAMLAGGTMPTVMTVPFTDIGSLVERDQVADITDYVADSEVLAHLNPALADHALDADGNVRGVPIAAYPMGLIYNRALFEQAGLDPDDPPQTWDEVREAAIAIEENTDAQGFQTMTTDNTGGWVLTTMSYAFGDTLVSEDGTANVDNEATAQALEFYRSLRWDDNVFGSNFLLNYGDANNAFAGGQVGMFVQGADLYRNAVVNLGMDPDDFGVAPLPQDSDGLGTLGGGNVAVVDPAASPEEIAAAVTWIEFFYFNRFLDQEAAVTRAEADVAGGQAVGVPEIRIVGAEEYDRWLGWVADYVNVPREHFELFLSTVEDVPIVPEPAPSGQEIYAALDPVVQAVLTRQDADIDQLLGDAQATVQGVLDAAE